MTEERVSAATIQAAIAASGARWTAGATSVADLSDDERKLRLGYEPGPGEPSLAEREATAKLAASSARGSRAFGAPSAFDLRNVDGKNFITSVKNQGNCGSCVAFGTTAAVEASIRFRKNDPNLAIDLSEAQLFYCVARDQGRRCNNGWWVSAALDAYQGQGIADEACYPYTAGDQACSNLCGDWQSRVTKITSYSTLSDTNAMKDWLSTKGALAACFTVYSDFYSYTSGVYQHATGGQVGGHCVNVVGYDDAASCWICKNSWGTGWGESGFFRIAYGDCGIDASMWGVDVTGAPPAPAGALYRYWNPGGADHFYTTSWDELGNGNYGWALEGIQCYVATTQQPGTVPLYRYWNPAICDHFYTTSWDELGNGNYGWGLEGIQCYVWSTQAPGTVPLYRYWNPGGGDHFYTTSWDELGSGNHGWGFEGVQCYVATSPSGAGASGSSGGCGCGQDVPTSFRTAGAAPGKGPSAAGSFGTREVKAGGAPSSFRTGRAGAPATFASPLAASPASGATPSSFETTQNVDGGNGVSVSVVVRSRK